MIAYLKFEIVIKLVCFMLEFFQQLATKLYKCMTNLGVFQ